MKKTLAFILVLHSAAIFTQQNLPPVQDVFMQGNNINTVFRTNGIFNYDFVSFPASDAGFVWPVTAPTRMTADFATGIWIGAKVGPQRELRLAASFYASHYSPGNIPVTGQIPPQSVCDDPTWRGYLVQLTDPSLTNGGMRTKVAGGRTYTFNYDSWANWPVQKGAPYVEVNNIPGYQPSWNGDRPGIGNGSSARPNELLFMVYMDYTNCTNNIHVSQSSLPGGSLPIGAEIQQLSFMFNCTPLQNMYFVKYKIINKSSLNWDSTYISLVNDADIGLGSCGASDDAVGCDTTRNLAFNYNGDNFDCNYGANPPALGTRFLQGPLRFTGNNTDTAHLPYDTLVGYKIIGMFAFGIFVGSPPNPCNNDPYDAVSGYNYMKGLNSCGEPRINPFTGLPTRFRYSGDACNRTGWFDSNIHDARTIQSTGPLLMNIGDTQIVVISFVISRDGANNYQNVCGVQSYSDSALKYYYNDFVSCTPIGIEPVSSEIPTRFALYQNYPNPFNPVTKIKFDIPKSGNVKIIIYDALGRQITELLNQQLQPGVYEADWDASNHPSGVYFYKLSAENNTETKKMVLIK